MDAFDGLPPATKTIDAYELSRQRHGLFMRAYTKEGKNEPLEARLQVCIKPTTIARLKLFCDDANNGYPSLEEVVDTAIHEYLIRTAW